MKRYASHVLAVVLATVLVGCAGDSEGAPSKTSIASTTTISDESAVNWLADLDQLDSGVRSVHPNPFWRVGEEEWNAKLAAAREVMPTLGRHQAEMVLFELTALLDGHSGIYPSEIGYHMYALRLYHFTDGYFLLDGPDPTAIGGELVAINGVPVAEAAARVLPLIAHDNDKVFEVVVPMYLMIEEILEGTGIVDDPSQPAFDILRSDGTHAILNPGQLLWDPYVAAFDGLPVGLPQAAQPLSQTRRNDPFWWTMVDDVLYLQYNQVIRGEGADTLAALVDEVRARLAIGDVRRVVVDIRHNNGGDYQTYAPLKKLLLDPIVDHPGGLYVIIGRQTFSAGVLLATELDVQATSVEFVGEPTGGSPNLYANVRPVYLASSGIKVNVSSHFFDFASPNDPRPWIAPDIAVELSSTD